VLQETPAGEDAYDAYVRTEWNMFQRNPARAQASLEAVAGRVINRMLDIGCGAGQELLPFVTNQSALGIGLDRVPSVGRVGQRLLGDRRLAGRIAFVRGLAEELPCRSAVMDLVVCRLALPYTRNAKALSEMARVLRRDGIILLKFHHARYYLRKLRRAVVAADLRSALYATRVLMAGTFYHLTGRQPHGGLLGGESFQSERLLRRELSRCGLVLRNIMPDSTPQTPSCCVVKNETDAHSDEDRLRPV
jgi:SAM-dependent methyltransferase